MANPSTTELSETSPERSSSAVVRSLIVWSWRHAPSPEQRDQLHQTIARHFPGIEVWSVATKAELPPRSLRFESLRPRENVLNVSADWSHGSLQKLFLRKAIEDQFERIIFLTSSVADESNISQILSAVLQSTADLVSLEENSSSRGPNTSERRLLGRAYRRTLLERIPFELNDDGALFDDDIERQQRHIDATAEVLTYTRSSNEEGFPLATPITRRLAELRFRLHRLGMCCSPKYRDLTPARYRDKSGTLYSSHQLAIAEVARRRPKTVLDLGCGPGFVARRCRETGAEVHGVDVAQPLPQTVTTFTPCNLDQGPYPFDIWDYDVVLLLDVIEHLSAPESFLQDLRHSRGKTAHHQPTLILTTPNIAFIGIRVGLLFGRFNYADRGILDITHRRLFTRGSLKVALESSGYDIESVKPVPIPFAAVLPGILGSWLNWLAAIAAWTVPGWFAFQWLVICHPKPGTGHLQNE